MIVRTSLWGSLTCNIYFHAILCTNLSLVQINYYKESLWEYWELYVQLSCRSKTLEKLLLAWPVKELPGRPIKYVLWQSFSATNQRRAAMAAVWLEAAAWRNSTHSSKSSCNRRFKIQSETSEIVIVTHQEAGDSDQVLFVPVKSGVFVSLKLSDRNNSLL